MRCIISLTTDAHVSSYSEELKQFLGNKHTTKYIYDTTSLVQDQQFLDLYFYGRTNQSINILIAQETENSLRIFIEGVTKRDNLDQLINGTKQAFGNLEKIFNQKKIKSSDIAATIWSEDEEIIKGERQSFSTHLAATLPDIPTGIYFSFLTILFTYILPKAETQVSISDVIKNLLILLAAVILWLLIKAKTKTSSSTINFKIK